MVKIWVKNWFKLPQIGLICWKLGENPIQIKSLLKLIHKRPNLVENSRKLDEIWVKMDEIWSKLREKLIQMK